MVEVICKSTVLYGLVMGAAENGRKELVERCVCVRKFMCANALS